LQVAHQLGAQRFPQFGLRHSLLAVELRGAVRKLFDHPEEQREGRAENRHLAVMAVLAGQRQFHGLDDGHGRHATEIANDHLPGRDRLAIGVVDAMRIGPDVAPW
jgi:hypothetical protein